MLAFGLELNIGAYAGTIAAVLGPKHRVAWKRERWETPDGDFIDLDWAGEVWTRMRVPLVVDGRNFLDRGAISLHPPYAQTLADYNKVIKQKKRLLQQAVEDGMTLAALVSLVQPWNEQVVTLATQIHRARNRYVDLLNEALDHNLFQDDISIRYVSALEGKDDLADYRSLITDRLQLRMQEELFAGACLIGPHRDDLLVLFGGREIRSFGSSGQQRSALITLDLAAISVYYSKHQNYPIFLIDDVDAELDGSRINRLLEYLDGRTQTFITTSKRSHFERFEKRANFYEARAGVATAEGTMNSVSVSA